MNIEAKVVGAALLSEQARRKMVAALADAEDLSYLFASSTARAVARAVIANPDAELAALLPALDIDVVTWIPTATDLIPTVGAATAGIDQWLADLATAAEARACRSHARAIGEAVAAGDDPGLVIDRARKNNRAMGLVDASTATARWRAWKASMANEPPMPMPLGLGNLMPFRMGQLWLLAARPGVGKTYFTIQHALQLARAGHPVLYISLEMPIYQLIDRFKQLETVVGELETLPISFFEPKTALTSFETIRSLVWSQGGWVRVVFIDHFKLIHDPSISDEFRSMASVATQLSHLAKGGPSIQLICHVNRSGASADRIGLEHLAGTGRLEEMADAVLLLTRSSVRVAKARYGRQGEVAAAMNERGRWVEGIGNDYAEDD